LDSCYCYNYQCITGDFSNIFFVDNKELNTTSGKKHWGLSVCFGNLPRINFCNGGQVRSPFTPTISYRNPLATRRTPPHIQTHLVFLPTLKPAEKPKEFKFYQQNNKQYGLFNLQK